MRSINRLIRARQGMREEMRRQNQKQRIVVGKRNKRERAAER
jgi:hypothetical protein